MNFKKPYLVFLLAVSLISGCGKKGQYTSKPAKGALSSESELLDVSLIAYHVNDSVTQVYMSVVNENLLYKRPDTSSKFYASLRVRYQLEPEANSRRIIDSSSFNIHDQAAGEKVDVKSLYSVFTVKAMTGSQYHLEAEIFDINRRSRYVRTLTLNKLNRSGPQNFLVRRRDTVAFKNNFMGDEMITVEYSDKLKTSLTVECYFHEFGAALPPFSTKEPEELKYKPDSSFEVQTVNGRFRLRAPRKGFYHVKAAGDTHEGLTIFSFRETYPGVSDADEMIDCARYIMSREEYDELKASPDKKAAIDRFWLGIGGSNERARELLRRYYGRVKTANRLYGSYAQGWKSDRGMIYIVFGQPSNIYLSKKDEIWVYGNEANPATLRFVFNKTQNPFSDNDYVMERSQFYRDPWHSAVDYWRQGHVYLDGR